jgi:RHS repeat-associated protein
MNIATLQRALVRLAFGLSLAFGLATPARAQYVEYIHTDALGSPVSATDANRVVLEHSDYEPYGKVLNHPSRDEPGYAGHVSDSATGLSYMQQRYYDPNIGRFLSVDPVAAADDARTSNFNRYKYAGNSPYRFTDPDGRQEMPIEEIEAERNELREELEPDLVPVDPAQMAEPQPSLIPDFLQGMRDRAEEAGRKLEDAFRNQGNGRSGRQERLREISNDQKSSRSDRGWIRNEQRQIKQGNRSSIRNPPGKDLAHERGREAAKGYSYRHSNLQDRELHRTQHKFDDFGRANKERPLKDEN